MTPRSAQALETIRALATDLSPRAARIRRIEARVAVLDPDPEVQAALRGLMDLESVQSAVGAIGDSTELAHRAAGVKAGHTWDGIELLARRLLGWPDGVLGSIERLTEAHDGIDAVKVRMAESAPPLITRGPRKGRPNWAKATTRIYPIERLDQEAQAWSAETGRCYPCLGSGQELARWTADAGPVMRPCRACGGGL